MEIEKEALAENVEIGYQVTLAVADISVIDRKLYHGRLGGEIDALREEPMYFYAEGQLSSVFAEHIFINGDTYELAAAAGNESEYQSEFLAQAPVVFPVRVTMLNPVVLDMATLAKVATHYGLAADTVARFVADFEDSDPVRRAQVFDWARLQGHDGAIIVNDMTPEHAGGDWCFRTSYVAFHPPKQVVFAFSDQPTAVL